MALLEERIPRASCSVAIFAYNEEKNIARAIRSISAQAPAPRMEIGEILVIASGCTDNTVQIAQQLRREDDRLTVIEEAERHGKAHAVNIALRCAKREIIVLIPGDVVPEQTAVAELCRTLLNDPRVGVVCGMPCPTNDDGTVADRIAILLWRLHNRTLKVLSREKLATHACGELMAIRKDVIPSVDEDVVNEDAFIGVYAWRRGYQVAFNEAARVLMKAPNSVPEIVRQRTRALYGHHMVKRRLGYFPRTLGCMIFYDLKRTLKILQAEISDNAAVLPEMMLLIFLELLAHSLIIVSSLRKIDYSKWSPIESTKAVFVQDQVRR